MAQPQVNQVYPNTYTLTPPFSSTPPSNSNSNNSVANGSFRSVFVVLAVVVAISGIACLFGRICSGRKKREKETKEPKKGNKDEHRKVIPIGPKEWESRKKPSFREGEIEFGFDNKRIPPSSSNSNNNNNSKRDQGVPKGPKPYQGFKGRVHFADNV